MSGQDLHWMHRALSLARRGIALAAPNPAVGCVLLDRSGNLAGEGFHQYGLRDHAEIAALKNAGCPIHSAHFAEWVASDAANRLKGGTAYVTLEPCNHTGRTPPCTQALIAAGISRVVAATIDPNPAVAGRGLQTLQAAGIQTTTGPCEPEARRLNEPFACWSQHRRPFVQMKIAMTLDGRIAPDVPPPSGPHQPRRPHWITNELSRAAVQSLRWQADAVLTGIGTVLADDPLLTSRSGLPRRRPLQRIVLDSTLQIPLGSKLVSTAQSDLTVFTVSNNPARIAELRARGVRVEILPEEAGKLPLTRVLDQLGSEDILSLLTETGSRLNTALLAANLVDRIHFFISPQIMGAGALPAFQNIPTPIPLPNAEIQRHGNDLALTSLLRDPWPPSQL